MYLNSPIWIKVLGFGVDVTLYCFPHHINRITSQHLSKIAKMAKVLKSPFGFHLNFKVLNSIRIWGRGVKKAHHISFPPVTSVNERISLKTFWCLVLIYFSYWCKISRHPLKTKSTPQKKNGFSVQILIKWG